MPANYIAKWDGSAWSALGSGMNSTVYALAVSGTNLYAGGAFTTAGGVPANYDRQMGRQRLVGLGLGDRWIVLVIRLCAGGERDRSLRGGWFTTAGGVPANCIAKWDGSAWSALGSGVSGGSANSATGVNALAADGVGHLFVGGNFSLAGTNASPTSPRRI